MPRLAQHCAVALMFLSPCFLAAADRQATSCYRLGLQNPPDWITSGATWDRENERLLLVDPNTDQVVSYNLLGEREPISSVSPDLQPAKIARSSDGFLLELVDGSMLRLDRRLTVTSRLPAAKLSPNDKTPFSFYQWTVTESGDIVAFVAMSRGQDKARQYGFFRIQGNSELQPLLPADPSQANFFLHGYPYITSTSDETFFLSMAEHPAIYRVSNGKAIELKNALPRRYRTRPDFTNKMTGAASAVQRFEDLEKLSIPAGLYAQDGYLYLLTREPASEEKTAWRLYQIDPAGAGNVLGQVRLPTSANHLTVIPTPDRGWMFIERGKVGLSPKLKQTQKVGPMVVISNAAIRSLSVPTSCPDGGGILWANETHSRALFVPEALVASRMVLPVDIYSRHHLDRRLARESNNSSPCDFLEPSMGQGTLPDASRLEDLVTSSQIAVVGKIVSTEPGWDALLGRVVTKVNLEVTRPLKGSLKAGSQVAFLSPGGSMLLANKRVCTSPRRGFYQPRAGDEIVVSAEPSTTNSQLLESPYVFPLKKGNVQPEPYPDLISEQKPLPLNKLLVFSDIGSL